MNLPLDTADRKEIQVPPFTEYASLQEAYVGTNNLVNRLIQNKQSVIASRIYDDFFTKPRSRQLKILGVGQKAAKECERLQPGGTWLVHCVDTGGRHQFMAWYRRFLPYAYAMMNAEDGFEARGIDFESINAYFKTCMGFVDLGQGYGDVKINHPNPLRLLAGGGNVQDYTERVHHDEKVMVKEDLELFDDCYQYSCKVGSPSLPFDEAYQPCFCFVAFQRPDLFVKYIQGRRGSRAESINDWRVQHFRAVAEAAGKPTKLKWKS